MASIAKALNIVARSIEKGKTHKYPCLLSLVNEGNETKGGLREGGIPYRDDKGRRTGNHCENLATRLNNEGSNNEDQDKEGKDNEGRDPMDR